MVELIGVGPGNPDYFTVDVKSCFKDHKNLIAFRRVAESLPEFNEKITVISTVAEIINHINKYEEVGILASGDPCFFSILDYLKKNHIKIDRIRPGLSSVQYLMSQLQMSWQGASVHSFHGRPMDLELIKESKMSVILTDRINTPSKISKALEKENVKGKIYAGFNLSYKDEKIIKTFIGEHIEAYSELAVVVIQNEMD